MQTIPKNLSFPAILGMNPSTLYRYEGGALQDQVHDELIRLCRKPAIMSELFARHAASLAPLQIKRFEAAIGSKGGVGLGLVLFDFTFDFFVMFAFRESQL